MSQMKTLILGLGNILLRDEGLGVLALRRLLNDYDFPEEVLLLDGGTGAFYLLPYLEEAERVLVLDAICAGREPGSLIEGSFKDFSRPLLEKISLHEVSFPDLIALLQLRGKSFQEIYIIGIEPEDLSIGEGLSPPVERALPLLIKRVLQKLEEWGVPYTLKAKAPK